MNDRVNAEARRFALQLFAEKRVAYLAADGRWFVGQADVVRIGRAQDPLPGQWRLQIDNGIWSTYVLEPSDLRLVSATATRIGEWLAPEHFAAVLLTIEQECEWCFEELAVDDGHGRPVWPNGPVHAVGLIPEDQMEMDDFRYACVLHMHPSARGGVVLDEGTTRAVRHQLDGQIE